MILQGCALLLAAAVCDVASADGLMEDFRNPPDAARPEAWWHWMDGEVSKAGLTADLAAAKEMGLSALHLFNTGCSGKPNVIPKDRRTPFLSPQWEEDVKHALRECKRLGLGLYAQNCAGWSGSGGPWIAPSNAMFHVEARTVPVPAGRLQETGRRFAAKVLAIASGEPARNEVENARGIAIFKDGVTL